jgi:signal transduction histidine kinase
MGQHARLFLVLACLSLVRPDLRAQEPLLRLADLVRLSPEEAARPHAVHLEATLIYCDLTRSTYFVHDGTAASRVVIAKDLARTLTLYDRVEVRGVSRPGGFLTDMIAESLRVTGRAEPPPPRVLEGEEIFDVDACAQWISVVGFIKGTSTLHGSPALEVAVSGWTLSAVLPGDVKLSTPPWHLLEARVRITAVAGTFFNQERQMTGRYLHVPSMQHIELLSGPEGTGEPAYVPSTGLMRPHTDPTRKVIVRGVALHYRPGTGLYLRDEAGALWVRTAQPLTVSPGDLLEAEGVPALEPFRPALRAIDVRVVAPGPTPQPNPLKANERRRTREQHDLVSLEAVLIARQVGPDALILQCESDGRFFTAQLERGPGASGNGPELVPGSRLRLAGLCELQSSQFMFLPEYVDGFHLRLRDAFDVEVLSRPPWWTAERLLWLVGALVVFAAAAGSWAMLLRWRVAAQTSLIREKVQRETVLEERNRIARDWHDTMEQQLMGVSLLVQDAAARMDGGESAAGRLRLAERMLRHCREESRASIRDLRSVALETGDLASACEELLRPLATAGGASFHLDLLGSGNRLPSAVEHQILRIAQEAVANAAKHARASSIRVRLDYTQGGVTLTVEDDGIGFDLQARPPDGLHLGLEAMRERARHLGAQWSLHSRPGQGTRVQVCWTPTPPAGISASETEKGVK